MQLYPEVPDRRRWTIARDVAVVLAVVLCAWLGTRVHDRVASLGVLAEGVTSAGNGVQQGFDSVAQAVDGVPVVGDRLSGALSRSGEATGGNVASLGADGEAAVQDAARLAGLLTFGLPTLLLVGLTVPGRVRQVREMSRTRTLLGGVMTPERERLLAMRAAFSLPVEDLMEFTPDPIGDLEAGRHDRLLAALAAEGGLAAPGSTSDGSTT